MVWENGVQVGQSQTLGLGLVGGAGIGVGGALTNSESKSLAAARLAPPVAPKIGGAFWVSLLMSFAWLFLFAMIASAAGIPPENPMTGIVMIGGIVAIFWWFYSQRGKKVRKVAAEHAARTDAWSKLWYCNRCGTTGEESAFRDQAAA